MDKWRAIEHSVGYAVIGAVIVLLALICNCSRPAPRPAAVVEDATRFADTTAKFYEIGDSVFVRATFVLHGRGVIVEIQPVKVKTRRTK